MASLPSSQRRVRPAVGLLALALVASAIIVVPMPAEEADANVLSCMNQPCCLVPCQDIGYAGAQMVSDSRVPDACSTLATPPPPVPPQQPPVPCAGPLPNVWIGNELGCQVSHVGDTMWQLYPPQTKPGDCGTFVWDGTTLFSPNFRVHTGATGSIGAYVPFTPVSQTATFGGLGGLGGPQDDPTNPDGQVTNSVTTAVTLGTTPLSILEVDTYTSGNEYYDTSVRVSNSDTTARSVIVYRAFDCFLGGADTGYGFLGDPDGAVGCSKNPNNSPFGRVEQLIPLTAGSHYYHHNYNEVWRWIGTHQEFPDTCQCVAYLDNGAGLSWSITIPPGESITLESRTRFATVYIPPPPPPPMPPRADFKTDTREMKCGPNPIQFLDKSVAGTSPIISWTWQFGDGTASTDRNPTHTYAEPGTYTVVETVQDSNGTSSSFVMEVTATAGGHCRLPTPGQDDGQVARPPRDGVDEDIANQDTDGDGVVDRLDNCPRDGNGDQADLDDDGFGNACDPDRDGDTILDGLDNCVALSNRGQADLDADGQGDACDLDDDGDLRPDVDDNCPRAANADQLDSDGNGAGDACDLAAIARQQASAQAIAASRDPKGVQPRQSAEAPWMPVLAAAAVLAAAVGLVVVVLARRK